MSPERAFTKHSRSQGEDFSANITRARFEEINAALFKSTIDPVEKVLKDAKVAREKVSQPLYPEHTYLRSTGR